MNGTKDSIVSESELLKANIKMVHKIVNKIYPKINDAAIDYDDLFSEGCIGLLIAIRRFDSLKGFKFSTFAYSQITVRILTYVDRTKHVKVPMHIIYTALKINKQNLQHEPVHIIAKQLSCPKSRVEHALIYLRSASISMDTPIAISSDDSEVKMLKDVIRAPQEDLTYIFLDDFFQRLTPIEHETLKMLMDGYERKEIIKYHGQSRGAIFERIQALKRKYSAWQKSEDGLTGLGLVGGHGNA